MRQYETIDWKLFAHQQQTARRDVEQSLARSKTALHKAKSMLQNILGYSRKLEQENKELQAVLHKAKIALQQRKAELASVQRENRTAYETLQREYRATCETLQQENRALHADIAKQHAVLQTSSDTLNKTQKQLEFAEQKLKFAECLQYLDTNVQPAATSSNENSLAQFFEYKQLPAIPQYQ